MLQPWRNGNQAPEESLLLVPEAAAAWEALLKQGVPGIPLLGTCENTGSLACPTQASRPH